MNSLENKTIRVISKTLNVPDKIGKGKGYVWRYKNKGETQEYDKEDLSTNVVRGFLYKYRTMYEWVKDEVEEPEEEYPTEPTTNATIIFVSPDEEICQLKGATEFFSNEGSRIRTPSYSLTTGYQFNGWVPEVPKYVPADLGTVTLTYTADVTLKNTAIPKLIPDANIVIKDGIATINNVPGSFAYITMWVPNVDLYIPKFNITPSLGIFIKKSGSNMIPAPAAEGYELIHTKDGDKATSSYVAKFECNGDSFSIEELKYTIGSPLGGTDDN